MAGSAINTKPLDEAKKRAAKFQATRLNNQVTRAIETDMARQKVAAQPAADAAFDKEVADFRKVTKSSHKSAVDIGVEDLNRQTVEKKFGRWKSNQAAGQRFKKANAVKKARTFTPGTQGTPGAKPGPHPNVSGEFGGKPQQFTPSPHKPQPTSVKYNQKPVSGEWGGRGQTYTPGTGPEHTVEYQYKTKPNQPTEVKPGKVGPEKGFQVKPGQKTPMTRAQYGQQVLAEGADETARAAGGGLRAVKEATKGARKFGKTVVHSIGRGLRKGGTYGGLAAGAADFVFGGVANRYNQEHGIEFGQTGMPDWVPGIARVDTVEDIPFLGTTLGLTTAMAHSAERGQRSVGNKNIPAGQIHGTTQGGTGADRRGVVGAYQQPTQRTDMHTGDRAFQDAPLQWGAAPREGNAISTVASTPRTPAGYWANQAPTAIEPQGTAAAPGAPAAQTAAPAGTRGTAGPSNSYGDADLTQYVYNGDTTSGRENTERLYDEAMQSNADTWRNLRRDNMLSEMEQSARTREQTVDALTSRLLSAQDQMGNIQGTDRAARRSRKAHQKAIDSIIAEIGATKGGGEDYLTAVNAGGTTEDTIASNRRTADRQDLTEQRGWMKDQADIENDQATSALNRDRLNYDIGTSAMTNQREYDKMGLDAARYQSEHQAKVYQAQLNAVTNYYKGLGKTPQEAFMDSIRAQLGPKATEEQLSAEMRKPGAYEAFLSQTATALTKGVEQPGFGYDPNDINPDELSQ